MNEHKNIVDKNMNDLEQIHLQNIFKNQITTNLFQLNGRVRKLLHLS